MYAALNLAVESVSLLQKVIWATALVCNSQIFAQWRVAKASKFWSQPCEDKACKLSHSCLPSRTIKRRVMLLLGLFLSSVASLGFALSVYIPDRHRFWFSIMCLLLRVVNGVGAAAVDTSSMAICAE